MPAALTSGPNDEDRLQGFGAKRYRAYVLVALTIIYIMNFIDRGLLSVVAPSLKPELKISDTAFGLLTGFGFSLLYTIVGVPLARFAETRHRVWIMTVCLALWSVMTALCGLAREITLGSMVIGGFWILLACRIGVGIGEAGCTPPATSLIADYFALKSRSTALGFYATGVTLGTLLANLIGGPITDAFGWRSAFLVLGAPGILIALIFKLTVREPPRGFTDPPVATRRGQTDLVSATKEILRKKSFWTVTSAATIASFSGYGITSFQSLYLSRAFGLTSGQAALYINVPVGLFASVGALGTGWLAEKMIRRHPNAIAWLPGVGMLACVPFYVVAFTTKDVWVCGLGLCFGALAKYGYLAAQYTVGQSLASARTRVIATALMLFVVNMLGYGFGPLFIGGVSDLIFTSQVTDLGVAGLTRQACEGALHVTLSAAQQSACAVVHPATLRDALLFASCIYAVGAVFFLVTCRWLNRDTTDRSDAPAVAGS